jgi:hypothetical protein
MLHPKIVIITNEKSSTPISPKRNRIPSEAVWKQLSGKFSPYLFIFVVLEALG